MGNYSLDSYFFIYFEKFSFQHPNRGNQQDDDTVPPNFALCFTLTTRCNLFFSNVLQEHGAAFDAGGLEVGQLILEVDGNKVEGMHHQVIFCQACRHWYEG